MYTYRSEGLQEKLILNTEGEKRLKTGTKKMEVIEIIVKLKLEMSLNKPPNFAIWDPL
jgi:hypothetical protein